MKIATNFLLVCCKVMIICDINMLVLGGSDGIVRIWDFNGHCHHQLVCDGGNPAEISQVNFY